MRVKHMLVGAALTAALVIPAAVEGATPQQLFVGEFDDAPDSAVRLKTGVGQGYAVKAFGGHEFGVSCPGEDPGTVRRAAIKGRFPIGKRGNFHIRDDNGETVLNVRGHVGTRKASGRFRFSGDLVGEDGETHTCDSDRIEWKAKLSRGPEGGP